VLQVAPKHLGAADLDLVVGIVYEQPRIAMPSLWSSLRLEAPVLVDIGDDAGAGRISVNRTLWRVELPGGYSARLAGGDMHEVVSSIEFASKVDANIREIERLSGLLDGSDASGASAPSGAKGANGANGASDPSAPTNVPGASRLNRRQRAALEGNVKKLQQQLGDNAIDLEQTSREADRIGDRQQIERGLIEKQKEESLEYLRKARRAVARRRDRAEPARRCGTRSCDDRPHRRTAARRGRRPRGGAHRIRRSRTAAARSGSRSAASAATCDTTRG